MASTTNEHLQVAHKHRVEGQYDEAIGLYRVVIDADASAAEAWWGLGLSLMNTGEFDEAVETLTKACDLADSNAKFWLDLGKLQTMLGMFDEAKPVFEKVMELAPGSKEADEAGNQLRYY
jgi:tetratricopeptide (TPR) repeat protein